MPSFSERATWFVALLMTALVLTCALWLQTHNGLVPCPLCLLQRFTLMLLMPLFLLGALKAWHARWWRGLLSLTTLALSSAGIFLAGRQVWLQNLPPNKQGDCGLSLSYMLHALPFKDAIMKAIAGSAECGKVDWQLWHLSLAQWSLAFFVLLLLISIRQLWRSFSRHT